MPWVESLPDQLSDTTKEELRVAIMETPYEDDEDDFATNKDLRKKNKTLKARIRKYRTAVAQKDAEIIRLRRSLKTAKQGSTAKPAWTRVDDEGNPVR